MVATRKKSKSFVFISLGFGDKKIQNYVGFLNISSSVKFNAAPCLTCHFFKEALRVSSLSLPSRASGNGEPQATENLRQRSASENQELNIGKKKGAKPHLSKQESTLNKNSVSLLH
jgi:hypothetical protein